MHWNTDRKTSGYSQAAGIERDGATFHQPAKGKSHVRENKEKNQPNQTYSYTAQLQIVPLCNPSTKSNLRSTVALAHLRTILMPFPVE